MQKKSPLKNRNIITILKVRRLLLLSFCLLSGYFSGGATSRQVSINEFMSSNGSVIADEDGDYEDWIELYNYGSEAVSLSGFFLSDDISNPYKWEFPHVSILPGDYLLVWASGKNRKNPTLPLHTNFRIDKQGEELLLTSPDGTRVDELKPVYLNRNTSFARYPDGTGSWLFSPNPTPRAPNTPHPTGEMPVHFWLFDTQIPNNTPLSWLEATYSKVPGGYLQFVSALEGYPFHEEHPQWRKASMERRNDPTPLNYLPEANNHILFADASVRGLQIKQPFYQEGQQNTLIFHAPANGFRNIVFRFAARNEGAAEKLMIAYTTDPEKSNWNPVFSPSGDFSLSEQYLVYEIDFSATEGVANNADFAIKIQFEGDDMEADMGNRVTFNNISLTGTPMPVHYVHATAGENGMVTPFGFTRVFDNQNLTLSFYPTQHHVADSLWINGNDYTGMITTDSFNIGQLPLENITGNKRVHATFTLDKRYIHSQPGGVLIYPNPAQGVINFRSEAVISQIVLFDLTGKFVMSENPRSYHHHLRLSLGGGVYLVRITTSEGVVYRKIKMLE